MTNSVRDTTKFLGSVAIAFGMFGSPLLTIAAVSSSSKDIKVESGMIVKDASLLQKVNDAKAKKNIPVNSLSSPVIPASVPKFRTSEELAVYNFQQKLLQLKSRLDQATKQASTAKSEELKAKARTEKLEKDLNNIDKRLELSKNLKSDEITSLREKQSTLKRSVAEERLAFRAIQSTVSKVENEIKQSKQLIAETEATIREKGVAAKKKLAELAVGDKKELERKLKMKRDEQLKALIKAENKAKEATNLAATTLKRSSDSLKAGITARDIAQKDLKESLKLRDTLLLKIKALEAESDSVQKSVDLTKERIASGEIKVSRAENDVEKLKSVEKASAESYLKSKAALEGAQKASENAKKILK